jgi:YfiH family protein
MIRPPAPTAVVGSEAAFTDAGDGDIRGDQAARASVAARLQLPIDWATLTQVHGVKVIEVDAPGNWGEADALFTSVRGLPLAVFTADCAGIVVGAENAVGVAHAGWRGALSGAVAQLTAAMIRAGHTPLTAAIGPLIGPCCFEVGDEVADRFPRHTTRTTWGTTSVDLRESLVAQINGFNVWSLGACTVHEPMWHSHRRNRTEKRMAAIGWLS